MICGKIHIYYKTKIVLKDGGHGSRSGSQHGSRDNSAARNQYSASRSLQQMRPMMQPYNTLPMNSSMQKGMRSDSKVSAHYYCTD